MADDAKTTNAPKTPAKVVLYSEKHAVFELGAHNLPDLRPEGTEYSATDADTVRTLCRKYKVRFFESA